MLGPVTAAAYLVHAAVVAGIDQIAVTSVTPFIGYALGIAVIVRLTPRAALLTYGIGLIAFVRAITDMQPSAQARMAELPNGVSIVAVSLVLATALYATRRRDFAQRLVIDQQRKELSHLNAGLEQRVSEQVAEAVARAAEVERLNAQLRAQVRERSAELSIALARVAHQRDSTNEGGLRAGSVLADRFEVEGCLGEGSMGAVYAGTDRTTGSRVAIKVVQASSRRQLDALRRFLREARTAASVRHPAVVEMLHVDVSEDGMLFQVQELVEGFALRECCGQNQRWEAGLVARVGAVLCSALAAAHEVGVVHRDVKPSNVMLTPVAPGMRLLDFGIAKLYEDADTIDRETRTGMVVGTPEFMAPEQVTASRNVSGLADVYAVGVTMFVLLTGRHPFVFRSMNRMLFDHVMVEAPDVRSIRASHSRFDGVVDGTVSFEKPEARPSAAELAVALGHVADERGAPSLDALVRAGVIDPSMRSQTELQATLPAIKRGSSDDGRAEVTLDARPM